MINFFRNLFASGNKQPHHKTQVQESSPQRPRPETKCDIFRVGDVIAGKYKIQRKIGEGGFGVVYLAYRLQIKEVCALKTFRDELLADASAREAYKKEAFLWVNLEEHPFILAARWVEEVSGRLFVEMDYVEPDASGRVSLADHLAKAGKRDRKVRYEKGEFDRENRQQDMFLLLAEAMAAMASDKKKAEFYQKRLERGMEWDKKEKKWKWKE